MEPGGHFVHEGTTLLSHQQLRSRLAGEVGGVMMVVMMVVMVMTMMMDTKKMIVIGSFGKPRPPTSGEISEKRTSFQMITKKPRIVMNDFTS